MENKPADQNNPIQQNPSEIPQNQPLNQPQTTPTTPPPSAPNVTPPQVPTGSIQTPPENSMSPQSIVGPHENGSGKGFKIFVIIGVLIILAVWGGVVYLYFQNKSLKDEVQEPQKETETTQVTPTPEFTPDQVKIKSGNVIREKPSGEITILVNK
jgi:hypothetical protein